ncbi:peptidase inhibitor family I36 protein [Streptomyces sp. NPDC057740]|uniref:peptidase inhibitor family I36 protein n=1 Tax=Streptomyces sp. NPDC057740 TaxID=3346234 RepID=UPI00367E875F
MSARKKALVGLASAALVLGFSGTASAGSYNGVCESSNGGEVCLYRLANYSGGLYDTLYSKPDYNGSTYYGTSTLIDNTMSSVKNMDTDTLVYFYQYAGYTGNLTGLPPGEQINQMPNDNTASSHCFGSNSACPNH